jgi:hypothetical protein
MSPAPDPVSAFIRIMDKLDREKNSYDLFRDFCEMAYCSHAKLTAGTAITDGETSSRADQLEARYMQIVGTYSNKDTVRAFPELLGIAWIAIENGGCDFLGSVASQMEVLNARIGQFFTPYTVSRMIAEMSLQDVATVIEQNGFVTIAEPACGAGGMVLAAADVLQKAGFDIGQHMLVNAVDISPLCFHMTYLQATLRGIPALVELGDTLRNTRTESAWTPSTLPFHAKHGRLFPVREAEPHQPPAAQPAPIADVTLQLDLFG